VTTRTAVERQEARRIAHRAAVSACPTQEVLGRLGDKWVPLVLRALRDGPRRHGELARTVAGARQKVLTQTLRGLERDGLVTRTVTAGVPVRVDYALTALGRSLLGVVDTVAQWADQHVPALHAARRGYDDATERAIPGAAGAPRAGA
jgi:DNA-binding HxlR family transcriptional regulator